MDKLTPSILYHMKRLLLILFIVLPLFSSSQTILITQSNDTIICSQFHQDSPKCKYWIKGDSKAKKIDILEIATLIDVPEYVLTKNDVDDFTGNSYRITKEFYFGTAKNSYGIFASKLQLWFAKAAKNGREGYFISAKPTVDLGCSGANVNYLIIKLKSGEIIRLNNDRADINCGALPFSMYMLNSDEIDLLNNNSVTAIRFAQSEGFEDYYTIFPDCIRKSLNILNK